MADTGKAQVTKINDEHYQVSVTGKYGDVANAALTQEQMLELFFQMAKMLPQREVHDLLMEWSHL